MNRVIRVAINANNKYGKEAPSSQHYIKFVDKSNIDVKENYLCVM